MSLPEGAARGPVWQGGWHRDSAAWPSPNFGARPDGIAVDLIVVHSISLPPGSYGGDAVAELFTNRLDWDAHPYYAAMRGMQVSSHFFIRRDGSVLQFVDCDMRAWHAGASHFQGRDNCNDYSIGVELEGLEGWTFEAPQYVSLAALCRDIVQRYPVADIAGHEHIAPGRKNDPGAGFDWRKLERDLPIGTFRLAG